MIKADLVEKVSQRTGLDKVVVKNIVDSFLINLRQALEQGQRIELRNFGVFQVRRRRAKVGRNPRTGERVEIPERLKITFKPSKSFKKL